jgi:hypothetical protein
MVDLALATLPMAAGFTVYIGCMIEFELQSDKYMDKAWEMHRSERNSKNP